METKTPTELVLRTAPKGSQVAMEDGGAGFLLEDRSIWVRQEGDRYEWETCVHDEAGYTYAAEYGACEDSNEMLDKLRDTVDAMREWML